MTARTDDARTLLATVLRVLVTAWRYLDITSRVVIAAIRALIACVGLTAFTVGIERTCGPVIGFGAVVAWVMVGAAVIVVLNRRDSR